MEAIKHHEGEYTQQESLEIEYDKIEKLESKLNSNRFFLDREGMKEELETLKENVKKRTQFILEFKD